MMAEANVLHHVRVLLEIEDICDNNNSGNGRMAYLMLVGSQNGVFGNSFEMLRGILEIVLLLWFGNGQNGGSL